MTRTRVLILAALLAAAPLSDAVAQVRGPLAGQLRQNQAREEAREGQRVDMGAVVRRVSSGRPGRMLGVNERGGGDRLVYVVRWEYPGGRIADISVDGRTGRVIGER
jgi:hypothetical protein